MMGQRAFPSRTASLVWVGLLAAAVVTPMLVAGVRPVGRYNGVVFYDRWDNCYLFSGVYLMYVSEAVKETLRAYRGKSIEIDAQEIRQAMNPGDGLIMKLAVIGESKEDRSLIDRAPPIRGIELRATVSTVADHVKATVAIGNRNSSEISIDARALGFAVIALDKPFICPGDGTSCAVITRIDATSPNGKNTVDSHRWGWTFQGGDRLPNRLTLRTGEKRTTTVVFDLPKGLYQFVAGYGGGVHSGPCLASNAVPFDVK
jgi:hypothetical protein